MIRESELQRVIEDGGKSPVSRSHMTEVTATMLGDSVGYNSYRAINLLYGSFAKQIGENLATQPQGLSLLCDLFKPGEITNVEWVLIMRPELAEGLKRAKWL